MGAGFVICGALAVALSLAYVAALPRRTIARYRRRLRRMTPDELAAEARACAKWAGYERAFAVSILFHRHRDWSPASLARTIDDLYAKAIDTDRREGNAPGPGSLAHGFYDFGLAHVRDVLDERAPA